MPIYTNTVFAKYILLKESKQIFRPFPVLAHFHSFLIPKLCNVCEIEDVGLNKNDAMDVQDENQLVRPRRSVVSTTVQDCYKRFLAGNHPPSGFRKDHKNIRYICQQVPDNTADFFYSTMFDVDYGIPIYSAYVVRQAQASQFGTAQRVGVDNWRQEDGKCFDLPKLTFAPQKFVSSNTIVRVINWSYADTLFSLKFSIEDYFTTFLVKLAEVRHYLRPDSLVHTYLPCGGLCCGIEGHLWWNLCADRTFLSQHLNVKHSIKN